MTASSAAGTPADRPPTGAVAVGGHDVAVIGMACRFPGAPDLTAFRRLLAEGRAAFGPVPAGRWSGAHDPTGRDPECSYTDVGAFLDDLTRFPARHFGISARRAQVMDPQQHLLLDVVRAALEDAGMDSGPGGERGTDVGVFVGASSSNYRDLVSTSLRAGQMSRGRFGAAAGDQLRAAVRELVRDVPAPRAFTMTGTLLNMVAAVVGQTFDFRGPSVVVDAACSSSLMAVHEAVLHLRSGRCSLAVVGGVHATLVPDMMIGFSRIGAISRSGRCRPFDAAGDGFVLGEGAGAVLLKRLDDALADEDKIYAIIRGTGASNDGRGAGPMAPTVDGQVLALRRAYDDAAVDPLTVGLVEAHGTATRVGDSVEVQALQSVLSPQGSSGAGVCWLSSVKANIGHTMAAAGIAGLIKAALAVSSGQIPPFPEPFAPDPRLELTATRFATASSPTEWVASDPPRRAGVSSFGFGGTNVHLVLEEARSPQPAPEAASGRGVDERPVGLPALVLVSAPTRALLADHATALAAAVDDDERLTPHVVARELAARPRREHLLAILAGRRDELGARLAEAAAALRRDGPARRRLATGCWYGDRAAQPGPGTLTFAYPGQGAQRVDALRDLYDGIPAFRARLDELDAVARAETGVSLVAALYPAAVAGTPPTSAQQERLTSTEVCQPALAMQSVALTELLRRAGLTPDQVVGHSVGELCAAAAGGVIAPDDLVRLAARRGQLMAEHSAPETGAMLAVHAGPPTVTDLIGDLDGVWIANVNAPSQVVVSGNGSAVAAVAERAAATGVKSTPLPVSHAFHSPLIATASAALGPYLDRLPLAAARIPVIPATTGVAYDDPQVVRGWWRRHAVATVDLVTAARTLDHRVGHLPGPHTVLQVGAGRSMLGLLRASSGRPERLEFVALTGDGPDGCRSLLSALAELAVLGYPVDPVAVSPPPARVPVSLPPGPLEVERFWLHDPADAPEVVTVHLTAAATAAPDLMTGDTVSDLVALFREQNELLKRHLVPAGPHLPVAVTGTSVAVSPPATNGQVPPAVMPSAGSAVAPSAPLTDVPTSADGPEGDEVAEAVTTLVAGICGFAAETLEPRLTLVDDLGFDSIMLAELVGAVRRRWPQADVPDEALSRTTTIADLVRGVGGDPSAKAACAPVTVASGAPEETYRIDRFPEVLALRERLGLEQVLGIRNPYFSVHERVVNDTSLIGGREVINFSSYNYLGMSGDPAVSAAAQAAIDRYGTSVSASRLLSGEKPLHRELERELADALGTEDCIALVGGHATNVTVIGHLVGEGDLILHDALAHDSIIQGCRLSGAVRRPFPHGDWAALDSLLSRLRPRFRRVLIALEGVYSMDGDIPELPRFIEIKRRHGALLYVDEAHSFGTIGPTGRGIGEHFGVDPAEVDLWMGTLSKTLASCGGYIAGSARLVEYLKYTAPGFIYSVGLPPPSAAASLAALRVMRAEPERVNTLHRRAELFLQLAREAGIDTGLSKGTAVVPCIVGDSVRALRLAEDLLTRGINVNPILYPAVEESQARLRFFVTACHSEAQIRSAVASLVDAQAHLDGAPAGGVTAAVGTSDG